MKKNIILVALFAVCSLLSAQKPFVWILTDMSDKEIPGTNKEGTLNDPDDISAMAGYLLLANEFDTRGITVASTHRKEHANSPNQDEWTVKYFGEAYNTDLPKLQKGLGGYPKGLCLPTEKKKVKEGYIPVYESSIKKTAERFMINRSYDVNEYPSVKVLYDELVRKDKNGEFIYSKTDPLNVLCWGSLTEAAILVNYAIDDKALLDRIRFIAHWTDSPLHQGSEDCPECVANCREDAVACRYLKDLAEVGKITYYELGAIGQHGIVNGSPAGLEYYNRFHKSRLGYIFATGKFAYNRVDDSDCATYYVLLGKWGVTLNDVKPNGSNNAKIETKNQEVFLKTAIDIRNELERRVNF